VGDFLAFCVALILWWAAIVFGFAEGFRYWRLARQNPNERLGNQLEAAVRLVLGLGGFFIGVGIMLAVLSAGQVTALIFGPACLAVAFWVLRHYARNWQRLSTGGHRDEVLAHLTGIISFTAGGIAIMVVGL